MARTTLRGGGKLRAALAELSKKVDRGAAVRAGFFEKATYPDGTPVAAVAAYNEFGTSRIPARPFMRNTIAQHEGQWGERLGKALVATGYDTSRCLGLAGESIALQIQDSIQQMRTPPNAPATIAQKGFDKPLIDTGQMYRSVTYEVDNGN